MSIKISNILVPILALVILASMVVGHGGEKHDETEEKDSVVVDTTAEAIAEREAEKIVIDSILAIIQEKFVELDPIFVKGCFDCHTTRTNYPWYYNIPVISSMIDNDTEEAKKHMDMTNGFPFGGHGKPADDLEALRSAVEEGEMPPFSYRMMHWSAKPSDDEKVQILGWVESSLQLLASHGVYTTSQNNANSGGVFSCPMHPEETGSAGDKCSKCGMSLEMAEMSEDSK